MIRLIGAALLMAGCGGFGYAVAAERRRERALLGHLIHAIQEMEWELKYRLTELPDLCRIAGAAAGGCLKGIFLEVAGVLDRRETMDISGCFNGAISTRGLPGCIRKHMKQLGRSLGRYDLEGQLQGLQVLRLQCRKDLQELEKTTPEILRSYQTLALCSGAALVILLI